MKLSIITINLNNREGLERTIQSVINQTFTDFEYIVIDGGSTDGSVEHLQSFNPSTLQSFTWISEPDTGIYNAMNKGIKLATGEYLQFLNSGDWLYSDTILEEVFALNRTEDILYGDRYIVSDTNNFRLEQYPANLTFDFFLDNTICHQTIFSKHVLLINERFNENHKIAADWEFLLKHVILRNCSTYKLDKIIVYYPDNGISSNPSFYEIHMNERNAILKKYFPERILSDYVELRQLKSSTSSLLYKNIKFIVQFPSLLKFIRQFIRITVAIYCFFYHITPPKK